MGSFIFDTYHMMHSINMLGMITGNVSIMMGIMLIFSGIMRAKRAAEQRTFMSQQHTMARPVLLFIAGACMLMLPVVIRSSLLAVWGTSNPVSYYGGMESWQIIMPPIIMFVRLLGVWSMMRGIILVSRSGEGSQPGTAGRAGIHIIGGLAAIHIVGTVNLLHSIFGYV